MATEEIAGNAEEKSHTPQTLVVKKNGVPVLTMAVFLILKATNVLS